VRPTALRDRLHALYPETSARKLKHWVTSGRISVNGIVVRRGDAAVAEADRVTLGRPAIEFPAPLRLVHADADIIVVDKPPGLLTIATESQRERTTYRLLREWSEARDEGRIFVVHRLDRETSGLLVFARTVTAKRRLQAQFEARSVVRVYLARVEGLVRDEEGVLTSRLAESRTLRVRPVRDPRQGREAITRYRVLTRFGDATLLELSLVTGRRGQIRAQLADFGHPIVGDRDYGARRDRAGRVFLHATRLGFVHPTGRRVVFDSPPPPGLRRP